MIIETFYSRDVTSKRALARFKILNYIKSSCAKLFYIFSNIYFGTNCLKKKKKTDKDDFEPYQIFVSNFILLMLTTQEKSVLFIFLSYSHIQTFPHLLGFQVVCINYLLNLY